MDLTICYQCQSPLLPDNRKRIRKDVRPRKCKDCIAKRVAEKRLADPVKLLKHRLYNALKNTWPDINPEMYSAETVQRVLDRWESKSVISSEANIQLLCITPYRRDRVPEERDLVIVTSREAQRIARFNVDKLQTAFPADVWQELSAAKRANTNV